MTEEGLPATEAQNDTDASTHGPFTDGFLDALGRWQRGWRRNREARGPIAAALMVAAGGLRSDADDMLTYLGAHLGSCLPPSNR